MSCDRDAKTSQEVVENIILPSGFIEAEDYDFWAGNTSTIEQRRAMAAEMSEALDEDVSWAECREAARILRDRVDEAEARERGLKIEGYPWRMALRHARAVEKADSMTFEEWATSERFPVWYKEGNKRRNYDKLKAEARTDYLGKRK